MSMMGSYRMLNALENTTLAGAALNDLLADARRHNEFQAICGTRPHIQRLAATNAMEAVAASPVAMEAVAASPVAMEAVLASPVAMEAVAASPVAMEAVAASPVAMEAVAASPVAMEAVAASPVAMEAVAASPVAMEAVAASPVAMEAVAASPTAMEALRQSLLVLQSESDAVVAGSWRKIPTSTTRVIVVDLRWNYDTDDNIVLLRTSPHGGQLSYPSNNANWVPIGQTFDQVEARDNSTDGFFRRVHIRYIPIGV